MPDEEQSKPAIRRKRRPGYNGVPSRLVLARREKTTIEQEQIRADLRYYIFNSLTFLGGPSMDLADADHECPHGRLRGDPSPACGCYVGEGVVRTFPTHQLGRGTGEAA